MRILRFAGRAVCASVLAACGMADATTNAAASSDVAPVAAKAPAANAVCAVGAPETPAGLGLGRPDARAPDAFDEALAMVGSARGSFGLSGEMLATSKLDPNDTRILSAARGALAHPADLPAYGRAVSTSLDGALATSTPVTNAILVASTLRDEPASHPCLEGAWLTTSAGHAPLASVLAELRRTKAVDDAEVAGVPLDLQTELVPILRAAAAANGTIATARAAAPAEQIEAIASIPSLMLGIRYFEWSPAVAEAFGLVDVRAITSAGASIAFAVERAALGRFSGRRIPPLDLRTPFGRVVLRGASGDVLDVGDDPPLFVLDTGGSDVYRGAVASATLARPVSVLVDLGGDDTYAYDERPTSDDAGKLPSDGSGRIEGRTKSRVGRQGAAVLGAGLLFDLGTGKDHYRSLAGSQGTGSYGVGVLYDEGGDDTYEAEGFSQGAAAWGIGLLLDRAGADRYAIQTDGQGFGFARGIGGIVDGGGDDVYAADPGLAALGGTLVYPSEQVPGASMSFAQGCGVGQRPDGPAPGYPFPGGIGLLRDASGDDRYSSGVFAQGCGFVQGLGMMLDAAGADAYDGIYYVQGIAVHMGAALFLEGGGNDTYDARYPIQGPALGFAHDLSVAVQLDEAGDDTYAASTLALGTAYANGAAVFADAAGDDRFSCATADCFGAAFTADVRDARRTLPTTALFVKAGGHASYVTAGSVHARSGTTWRSRGADASDVERGAAVDAPAGKIDL